MGKLYPAADPCCMPKLSATTHAELCAMGAHSTTSVLPAQLDLGCTEGGLQGLHNAPPNTHTQSRGCTRVTCTHPHMQHWDTPTATWHFAPTPPRWHSLHPVPLGGSPRL